MDDPTSDLAAAIGARVRERRQSRRWTLDQLAAQSGVSRRLVVSLEQGATNPSVGTLLRLSEALGIGLPALVAPRGAEPVSVTRAGEGSVLWTGEAGGRGVLVAATSDPDGELWDWTLGAGDQHASHPHAAGTRELLQVRQGQVVLVVAGESVTLDPDDAVVFAGDVAHSYANPGTAPARFSLAVLEPRAGTRTGVSPDA
jgi:transcriptional regulator with XRE-family HTH domain